jgi:hypothetical protein
MLRWIPWKYLIRRYARMHGFLDPLALLSRLRAFTRSEWSGEPIELLRAGAVFHSRGLLNRRVIQHNLDWVWPYWVNRQFDPADVSFIPRGFSITHVNLTHRNWTAVGLPDFSELPLVDPAGLATPFYDAWSLDAWILAEDGTALVPARSREREQTLLFDHDGLAVHTETRENGLSLSSRCEVENGAPPSFRMRLAGHSPTPAWLVVSLRPYNPEGISSIHEVLLSETRDRWTVDGLKTVRFESPVERHALSDYGGGDVFLNLPGAPKRNVGRCKNGMVTAAALYRIPQGEPRRVEVSVPLANGTSGDSRTPSKWNESVSGSPRLKVPDPRFCFLYESALRMLVLHVSKDVFPGPYTYKRFWFRDAAFILNALLCLGHSGRVQGVLERYPSLQAANGYFHSQEGEWDSNGQALWIMSRYLRMTGSTPPADWIASMISGARWIGRKRVSKNPGSSHAGLLPPGFSAEHFGPSDYYYWDDFWSVAGLEEAALQLKAQNRAKAAIEFENEAKSLRRSIEHSLEASRRRLGRSGIPSSPYRRLDSGAIGSLAASYPLCLFDPDDPRIRDTAAFLLEHCLYRGGFFLDMTHSGINPYLTLHIAQVLLRAGDPRSIDLACAVAALASPTGQWPEAVHPRTLGGCMGDGQHTWASAEWVLFLRNTFLHEEGNILWIGAGIPERWLVPGETLFFGPAPTLFGGFSVEIRVFPDRVELSWNRASVLPGLDGIEVRLPGLPRERVSPDRTHTTLPRKG